MTAPNQSPGHGSAKGVNPFSSKRLGIQKANTVMFGSIIAASVIVSFSLVTLNFLWNLRGFNNRVIEARSEALTTLQQNALNVQELKQRFTALEEDDINSKVVLDALPSVYDFPAIATSIDKQVEKDSLKLINFSGDDLSAEAAKSAIVPEPVAISFNLTVEGNYEKIGDFITNLEKTIRPLVIDSIELSGSDSAMTADLVLHTYYQPAIEVEPETKTVR